MASNRIKPEDMTKLIDASTAKKVSETAVAELEEMQVAHCINEAANCGQTSAVYCRPMSSTLLDTLVSKGYTVTQPAPIAKQGDEYIISWVNAE